MNPAIMKVKYRVVRKVIFEEVIRHNIYVNDFKKVAINYVLTINQLLD